MRTIWKGAISFGLVHIPVKLYPATERKDIKFKYLHEKCKTPIKYERRCPFCNVEVPLEEIVRGYEYEKGRFVVLNDEDFEDLPAASGRTVAIMDFVNLNEIDPIYFSKSYYLVPGDGGQKPYALLRRAMQESGKIAVARVAIRARESLAALRIYDDCLLMETMLYPDEIRQARLLPELQFDDNLLHENEIKMAVNLIGSLSEEFKPEKYTDEYRQMLLDRIQGKIEGQEIETVARPESEKVVDLLEALQASIRLTQKEKKARAGRGGKSKSEGVQLTTASKATAKKTAGRKRKTS